VSAAERERTIAPGGVIVRFLSRFRVLETSSAIDRPGGAIVRTTEEVNELQVYRTANDHTRAVIDRRYRKGTCKAERELEKKIKIHKLKITKRKKKKKQLK
jgi:hypothetical protein